VTTRMRHESGVVVDLERKTARLSINVHDIVQHILQQSYSVRCDLCVEKCVRCLYLQSGVFLREKANAILLLESTRRSDQAMQK